LTHVTIAAANLWVFFGMIAMAGLTGNVDVKARQERVGKAVLTTSQWNPQDDYDHMESSVSFALILAGSSLVPLLVWAVTYYVL
jgi:hypothetical protein